MADPLIGAEPAYDVEDEYRPEPEPIPVPPAWQDGSFRIGIHTSIAGDIGGALDHAEIAEGMRHAAKGMKMGGLRILVENTSGMGSAVGARFEEIKAILDQTRDLPVGVCLDTAHTLEAGYDIATQDGLGP